MSNIFKSKFKNFAITKRFNSKREKTKTRKLERENALINALNHPENTKSYRQALRTLAVRQTGANIKAFAKWLIIDLLWLLPPYIAYGWFQQVLNNTLLANNITNKMLWGIQEELMLSAIVVGALIILCGGQIIKNGTFQRPYKRGSLEKQMTASLKRDNVKH